MQCEGLAYAVPNFSINSTCPKEGSTAHSLICWEAQPMLHFSSHIGWWCPETAVE